MADLTDEQKNQVQNWCAEGLDLAAIQDKMDAEFGVRLTYLDTRMLIADLGSVAGTSERELERQKAKEKEQAAKEAAEAEAQAAAAGAPEQPLGPVGAGNELPPEAAPAGQGSVSVSVAAVTPPGMLVAGTVTFSDGKQSEWYLDQTGRLGLNPTDPDHKPSEADLIAFQRELQSTLKNQGL